MDTNVKPNELDVDSHSGFSTLLLTEVAVLRTFCIQNWAEARIVVLFYTHGLYVALPSYQMLSWLFFFELMIAHCLASYEAVKHIILP